MIDTYDLFAELGEVGEVAKQPTELEGEQQTALPSGDGLHEEPGSIRWYASKQREYWNKSFPHKRK